MAEEKKTETQEITVHYRTDGYRNVLNKYGTKLDNSTAYNYVSDSYTPDIELTEQYLSNGLFAKIIDAPAEEAIKHGYDLGVDDKAFQEYIDDCMEENDCDNNMESALKWARLYGGSVILMIVDDGVDNLELPLNLDRLRSIEELRTYERAVVTPDYNYLYNGYGARIGSHSLSKFAMPQFYQIDSYTGSFRVHESRLLLFRNGRLPERANRQEYRFWGQPEYNRLKRALREAITANSDGVKLLERSVQAIYKMKNLANLLSTEEGENDVLKRIEVIDLCRGILNSIVIDNEGEEYDFKSFSLTGIKEVIDSTCNMLSAISNIPQTILFGRSPAGMNSTGASDLENYYNFVERYRKGDLKRAYKTYIDLLCIAGKNSGRLRDVPKYKFSFKPLWNLSETEQAQVEQTRAATEQTKAQTAQIYVDMQALDPSEVRRALQKDGTYEIQDIIDEDDGDLDLGLDLEQQGAQMPPQGALGESQPNTQPQPQKASQNLSRNPTSNQDDNSIRSDGEWNESDHPRDEDGKFTSGSGSGKKSESSDKSYELPVGPGGFVGRKTVRNALSKLGHSQEDIQQMDNLFRLHTLGGGDQQKADPEIAKHISDMDSIGKLLRDKSDLEIREWKRQADESYSYLVKRYEESVEWVDSMMKPGEQFANYTKEDLKSMGVYPQKPVRVEPRFGRVGAMGRDVLAFTTDPIGPLWGNPHDPDDEYEGRVITDHDYTLDQMLAMGYRPIAGICNNDVGASGESEVLFAKFPEDTDERSDSTDGAVIISLFRKDEKGDSNSGVGVLVVKDGKVLVGNRSDTNKVGGPGGHIKIGETPEQAAIRETQEEMGIELTGLEYLGVLDDLSPQYGKPHLFFASDFNGEVQPDTKEMRNNRFVDLNELRGETLYEPFKKQLEKFLENTELQGFFDSEE